MKFLRIPYISGSTLIETAVASAIVMIVFMIATSIMSRYAEKLQMPMLIVTCQNAGIPS